jgi:hypothetical protein
VIAGGGSVGSGVAAAGVGALLTLMLSEEGVFKSSKSSDSDLQAIKPERNNTAEKTVDNSFMHLF